MDIVWYVVLGSIGVYFSIVLGGLAFMSGARDGWLVLGSAATLHLAAILFIATGASVGHEALAAALLVLPIFGVWAIGVVILLIHGCIKFLINRLTPDSPAFRAACKDVGPQYFQQPVSPVRSIAYDWDGGEGPYLNHYELNFGTRIAGKSYRNFSYPKAIEFIERRVGQRQGLPANSPHAYAREPIDGTEAVFFELSADVLVKYEISPPGESRKAHAQQTPITYVIVVSDRRNGDKLATLRYVVDEKNGRACGTTGPGVIDVRAFVLKAVGVR